MSKRGEGETAHRFLKFASTLHRQRPGSRTSGIDVVNLALRLTYMELATSSTKSILKSRMTKARRKRNQKRVRFDLPAKDIAPSSGKRMRRSPSPDGAEASTSSRHNVGGSRSSPARCGKSRSKTTKDSKSPGRATPKKTCSSSGTKSERARRSSKESTSRESKSRQSKSKQSTSKQSTSKQRQSKPKQSKSTQSTSRQRQSKSTQSTSRQRQNKSMQSTSRKSTSSKSRQMQSTSKQRQSTSRQSTSKQSPSKQSTSRCKTAGSKAEIRYSLCSKRKSGLDSKAMRDKRLTNVNNCAVLYSLNVDVRVTSVPAGRIRRPPTSQKRKREQSANSRKEHRKFIKIKVIAKKSGLTKGRALPKHDEGDKADVRYSIGTAHGDGKQQVKVSRRSRTSPVSKRKRMRQTGINKMCKRLIKSARMSRPKSLKVKPKVKQSHASPSHADAKPIEAGTNATLADRKRKNYNKVNAAKKALLTKMLKPKIKKAAMKKAILAKKRSLSKTSKAKDRYRRKARTSISKPRTNSCRLVRIIPTTRRRDYDVIAALRVSFLKYLTFKRAVSYKLTCCPDSCWTHWKEVDIYDLRYDYE